MAQVIVINGHAEAGKDTFVEFCSNYMETYLLSTVDIVKEVYRMFGWDGEKTDEARKWLSDAKDFFTTNGDLIWKSINKEIDEIIENSPNTTIFVMVREPEEIQRYVDYLDAITVLVDRDGHIPDNHADQNVYDFDYDVIIHNDGTLEDLDIVAKWFCKNLDSSDFSRIFMIE